MLLFVLPQVEEVVAVFVAIFVGVGLEQATASHDVCLGLLKVEGVVHAPRCECTLFFASARASAVTEGKKMVKLSRLELMVLIHIICTKILLIL